MPIKPVSFLFTLCFCIAFHFCAKSQYFAYIEAEGQQPFYLRVEQKLYSSNAVGFLILSRLDGSEMPIKIGFPENIYPEIGFTLNKTAKDRGFLLKLVDGVGWTLTEKGNVNQLNGMVLGLSDGNAALKSVETPQNQVNVESLPEKTTIDNRTLGERNGQLEMIYLEKQSGGKVDTVYVQIEKKMDRVTESSSLNAQAPDFKPCNGNPADVKDVRNLQKKLLGINDEDNQIALVVRTFADKCFNCKQTLEIAWFFVSEQARLKLFQQVMKLVSDPIRFPELEEAFLSDDGIGAFRQMIGLKY